MNISTNQLAGLIITLFGLFAGFFKYYLDAKIDGKIDTVNARLDGINSRLDGISRQLDKLMDLVIQHHEDIGTLKGKIK